MIKIKPKAGLIIRDPDTMAQLAAKGEDKPRNGYWLKRLKDGDVELIEPKQAVASKEKGAE